MSWSSAWSGSGVVVASSVQVVDAFGNVVASITPQGDINGKTISADTDIFLNGTSLIATLAAIPQGIVAQAEVAAANLPTAAIGAAETAILELDYTLTAGRQYRIGMVNMYAACTGICRVYCDLRYTTDGSVPLTTSSRFLESNGEVTGNENLFAIQVSDNTRLWQPTVNTNLRLLLTSHNFLVLVGGVQQTHQFTAAPLTVKKGPGIMIEDQGLITPDTGVFAGGGTNKVYRTFQIICGDSQSFTGSGPASNGSGGDHAQRMYYGQDPGFAGNGNWRSYAWFNTADTSGGNGLGSLNNLSGALAADISYLDVYVYTSWWYRVSGGTLQLGHNTSAVNNTSEPAGSTYSEKTQVYTARGQGKWISVKGTGIQTAILNGTFRGIVLGPGPDTLLKHYGYAAGFSSGTTRPQIRAGYYK